MNEHEEVVDPSPDGISEEGIIEEASLEDMLLAAHEEAARNLEGWQRTQAEFANARKRMEKQRVDAYTDANIDLVLKLLPVVDDFERALVSAPETLPNDGWLSGLTMVYRKFQSILQSMNVEPIEAVGQPFDPTVHEAISQELSPNYESGVVAREMQKGYRIGDRIVRPSLVVVAE